MYFDQALTSVIERSTATTMMGLEKELKDAASSLERHALILFSSHVEFCGPLYPSAAPNQLSSDSQVHLATASVALRMRGHSPYFDPIP